MVEIPKEEDLEDGVINGIHFEQVDGNVTPLQEEIFSYAEDNFEDPSKVGLLQSDGQIIKVAVNFTTFSEDKDKGYKDPSSPRDNHKDMVDNDSVIQGKINGDPAVVYNRDKLDKITDNTLLKLRLTRLFEKADELLEEG